MMFFEDFMQSLSETFVFDIAQLHARENILQKTVESFRIAES